MNKEELDFKILYRTYPNLKETFHKAFLDDILYGESVIVYNGEEVKLYNPLEEEYYELKKKFA